MAGDDHPGGTVSLQPTHRSQTSFQPSVVGLKRVVRVDLRVVEGRREPLIEDSGVDRYLSVVTSAGEIRVRPIARLNKLRAALASLRGERKTSMTRPNWSIARNR